jgi:glycosyltransferase 2 family protein
MMRAATLFALLGLAAAIALIMRHGYADVLAAFAVAGWGIVWANLFHLVPMVVASYAWILLWPGRTRPNLLAMSIIMWVRAAVNNLLPVARIGGEVVAARLLIGQGWRRAPAIASVVVETTISVITVFMLIISGIVLLSLHAPAAHSLMRLMIGALFSLPIIIALIFVQRLGVFGVLARLTRRMVGDRWQKLMGDTARLDRAILQMYRRSGRIWQSGFWMLVAWYLAAIELWLALGYLEHPLPLLDCIILEAMIQLVSSAAFVVPGALGAQEGAFVFFGAMVGLPPEQALALALIRRCRDLILYLPALLLWLLHESRQAVRQTPH